MKLKDKEAYRNCVYSEAKKFRSKLFINFGDPVSIKKYEEAYKLDKVKAINEFRKYR